VCDGKFNMAAYEKSGNPALFAALRGETKKFIFF
jgi:hypothetical protein